MENLLNSPQDFLYNLHTCSPTEARKMWKDSIKEKWKHKCAYCGENSEELSLDHIIPQMKGGNDHITNVLCACVKCNRAKGHEDWEHWFKQQKFFTESRYDAIIQWQRQMLSKDTILHRYKPRRNKVA